MERNIPDVRDIFGRSTAQQKQQQRPELRSYDCSPRSRRRHDAMDSYENNRLQSYDRTPSSETPPSRHSNISGSGNKKTASSRNRCSEDFTIGSGRKESRNNRSSEDFSSGRKTSAEDNARNVSGGKDGVSRNVSSKDGAGRNGKDAHHYSNRTLTERDIRHLERHLSMKKTIRKQISRNLAQAFVDDPDLVLKDTSSPSQKSGGSNKVERSFTLTRAKVSRSEQNVLDLLKDNEPDSGHCSADNPNSSDDDCNDLKTHQRHPVKQHEVATRKQQQIRQCPPPADSVVARKTSEQQPPCREDSKFSFWKMFSVKSKGKR